MNERSELARLRSEFDQSFAREAEATQEEHEELLVLRANDMQLALRANQTAGILRCPALTSLPSSHAALCGLAGVRNTLVAVYSLAELVGVSRGSMTDGWLVLCAADRSVALLFDELISYARVASQDILAATPSEANLAPAKRVAKFGGTQRPLLHIPELLESIYAISSSGATKA